MSDAPLAPDGSSPEMDRAFRWQALFQRSIDPIFVLDRRRRLVFVNRAWEAIAGIAAGEVLGLVCRRPRPVAVTDAPEDVLAHALTPPAAAQQGPTKARRLLPGQGTSCRCWDVEFCPIRLDESNHGAFTLGRVTAVAIEEFGTTPLPERLVALRQRQAERHGMGSLTSNTPLMRRLADQVALAARISEPALLRGEPGTGKKTIARIIHYQSPRAEQGFIALACRQLPPAAVSAVLFGEQTHATIGTLYLSDPGHLPRDVQLRLCEWLSQPAGDRKGPRLLTGFRTDPRDEVRAGTLLDELHAALSAFVLEVPPLRERREDINSIADRLLLRANEAGDTQVTGLSPEVRDIIRDCSWPGNLRELNDALTAARARAKSERIETSDLPFSLRIAHRAESVPGPPTTLKISLDHVLESTEKRLLERALKQSRGNKTKAAEMLGIWRQRLIRRMEALGIAEAEDIKTDG